MFERHVGDKLSAYLHGQLPEGAAWRVAEHLARCSHCEQELQEISQGAELADNLARASAPDSLWSGIQNSLRREAASAAVDRTRFWWPRPAIAALAAFLVVLGAALAWYFEIRQPLHVTVAAAAPSEFETAAIQVHYAQSKPDWEWDLATRDPKQLRDWLQLASGLHASVPDQRPREDSGRLEMVGVKLVQAAGARAAVIAYRVDSRPVTLLTARARDLHPRLGEGFLSKAIVYRGLDGDIRTFTWEASGQAYVMVSALPHFGERGCILCHTTPERRALIANMNPQRKN